MTGVGSRNLNARHGPEWEREGTELWLCWLQDRGQVQEQESGLVRARDLCAGNMRMKVGRKKDIGNWRQQGRKRRLTVPEMAGQGEDRWERGERGELRVPWAKESAEERKGGMGAGVSARAEAGLERGSAAGTGTVAGAGAGAVSVTRTGVVMGVRRGSATTATRGVGGGEP